MLMMLCSSFSDSNTRGVTSSPPLKESRPEIKCLGQVMERKRVIFLFPYFFGTRQGWYGVYSFITTSVHILQLT
jgi:hypothetical protein